MYVEGVPVIET